MSVRHLPSSHFHWHILTRFIPVTESSLGRMLCCFIPTFNSKAAGVQRGALGRGDIDLQAQLLQRPAVGLGHVLAGSSDVSLRNKQAAEAHVDVLRDAGRKRRMASGRADKQRRSRATAVQSAVPSVPSHPRWQPPARSAAAA